MIILGKETSKIFESVMSSESRKNERQGVMYGGLSLIRTYIFFSNLCMIRINSPSPSIRNPQESLCNAKKLDFPFEFELAKVNCTF